jgi:hypothetical protein
VLNVGVKLRDILPVLTKGFIENDGAFGLRFSERSIVEHLDKIAEGCLNGVDEVFVLHR